MSKSETAQAELKEKSAFCRTLAADRLIFCWFNTPLHFVSTDYMALLSVCHSRTRSFQIVSFSHDPTLSSLNVFKVSESESPHGDTHTHRALSSHMKMSHMIKESFIVQILSKEAKLLLLFFSPTNLHFTPDFTTFNRKVEKFLWVVTFCCTIWSTFCLFVPPPYSFCPNLSAISSSLHLTHNVAVSFLWPLQRSFSAPISVVKSFCFSCLSVCP